MRTQIEEGEQRVSERKQGGKSGGKLQIHLVKTKIGQEEKELLRYKREKMEAGNEAGQRGGTKRE